MAARCELCGKGTRVGNNVTRRGIAKCKGGIGLRITGRSKRRFHANIQKVRVVVDGTPKRMKVCTRCLKSNAALSKRAKRVLPE